MKILLLGSGFTKAFCSEAPTISSIHTHIRNDNLIKKINEIHSYGIDDDELVASIILDSSYDSSFENVNIKAALRYNYIKEVAHSISSIEVDDKKQFERFLEKYLVSKNDDDIVVITLNYDTLIEDNYEKTNSLIKISSNPYDTSEVLVVSDDFRAGIHLLKLHGSIDWFKYSYDDPQDIEKIFSINKKDKSYENIINYNNPVFIPFSFAKTEYLNGNLFKLLWQKFLFLLDKADEIEILGYSFPKTDYQISMKLYEYANKISRITILNDKNNIKSFFGNKVRLADIKDEYKV
jgi:hypothetical protein